MSEPAANLSALPAAFPGLREPHPALAGFHEPVRAWFTSSFAAPTRAQELGWPAILGGESTLILAPTGSGKTLAAFMASIDRLMFEPAPDKDKRCRVLYISPLKALAVDVERNLRAPLVGVARAAERMGINFHTPEIAVRTGDTPSRDRAAFLRSPSDILITTPESLYLLLTSSARETLRGVRWVIVDEIHAMVNTKRGAHLSLSLERLSAITRVPFQRIGLSATQRPLDEVSRFLGGYETRPGQMAGLQSAENASGVNTSEPFPAASCGGSRGDERGEDRREDSRLRPVRVIDAGSRKELDICVTVPVEDMARLGEVVDIPSGNAAQGEVRTSIWPSVHPLLLEEIRKHRSTLIFVNSRRLAERLAAALNELAGEDIVRAHHGSIAREQRLSIEDDLKTGRLPALVATSSLELGIDMGAIDLVIQVEAPPSVASGLQRIGRAGHHVGVPSKGIILPKYRGDLLACAALTERMRAGAVEEMHYPRNPLDVLAQQIVAAVAMDDYTVDSLGALLRGAAPFADLPQSLLIETLDMLSGRYPSDDFAELRPRITWDRLTGNLTTRQGAKRIAIGNGGTIPDRGLYGVFLIGAEHGKGRVGELDEEMVFETHVGETFLLGASSWRVEEITHDRVLVSPAPGVPGKMPFWHGESAGRPLEFGRAIGALTRNLRALPPEEATTLLTGRHDLDDGAARNLLEYLGDQFEATGAVPDDRTIVIERSQDEMGDWRICILSPFGGKVHAPWAMAIGAVLRESFEFEIDVIWTDDGIVVRFPDNDEPPDVDLLIPDPDEVEDLVIRQLTATGGNTRQGGLGAAVSPLFASRFREAAARALLLPRKSPGKRSPLWQQRRRSAELLQVTSKYGSFPIVLETLRECLRDVFDIPSLRELLAQVRSRTIRVIPVTTSRPSPFAAALMFTYVSNFIYELDSPLAERRAQALTVDPAQLRELLGSVELRDLLDADALAEIELSLAHLAPERAARHADGLHDMLLRLGDLSEAEIMDRVSDRSAAGGWIDGLAAARRIVKLVVGGEPRYIAAEEAGRYRDALGIPPPPGLPEAFLEYGPNPLGEIVTRYARTHGPFHAAEIATRYRIGTGPIVTILRDLEGQGRVVEGEFRPGASGREWCDSGVLRALRQRSLARLRREVEPVEGDALGRMLLAWQGVGANRRGRHAVLEVIEQLQGASIPASVLEDQVLASRIVDYNPHDLDDLTASGSVIWVGREPLGQHDGRVSLYLAEHAALLIAPAENRPDGDLHDAIREHLGRRGASFFPQIAQACGGFPTDVLGALWDLVWSGEVTNDMLTPLRAFIRPQAARARTRQAATALRSRHRTPIVLARGPSARAMPPEAAGRWSLVESLIYGAPTAAEKVSALARQLLDRYGVVTRETVAAEGIAGGFSAVYPVLKVMEESGSAGRGYFVRGLGAAQFALPGAADRLRAAREPGADVHAVILAATDPANPYGATLPWPEPTPGPSLPTPSPSLPTPSPSLKGGEPTPNPSLKGGEPIARRKPMRAAGANVILVDGALAAWLGRGERSLTTFLDGVPDREPEEVALAIARLLAETAGPGGHARLGYVEEVDGLPVHDTRMAPALVEAGYTKTAGGFLMRRQAIKPGR